MDSSRKSMCKPNINVLAQMRKIIIKPQYIKKPLTKYKSNEKITLKKVKGWHCIQFNWFSHIGYLKMILSERRLFRHIGIVSSTK